jgi:transitional endoplasmic reticulum ATPase
LDAIAGKREGASFEFEQRIVSQLLTLMDELSSIDNVIVIGATNRINAIDPALRRPGRFDREIEVGVPHRDARLEILQIHTQGMPLAEDVDLRKLADITHGFVGADLEGLVKEAAMHALRRVPQDWELSSKKIPHEVLKKTIVTLQDFTDVLKEIQPSALREVFVEIPNVKWKDIGGLDSVKQELIQAIEWPLRYRNLFTYANAIPPKGILLYGPPGTGKTLLVKAIANESEANFISIKGPELVSMWYGESERGIREIFRKAKQSAPCIIFFDEIDAIAPTRSTEDPGGHHFNERVVSQLLTELDGLEVLRQVVVIGATNRPDIVDPALLRAGRFDRLLYVPPADLNSRIQIIKIHTQLTPLAQDVQIEKIAESSEGFTGADIASFISAATMLALRDHISKYQDPRQAEEHKQELVVHMHHFEEEMGKIRPLSAGQGNSVEVCVYTGLGIMRGQNCQIYTVTGSDMAVSLSAPS